MLLQNCRATPRYRLPVGSSRQKLERPVAIPTHRQTDASAQQLDAVSDRNPTMVCTQICAYPCPCPHPGRSWHCHSNSTRSSRTTTCHTHSPYTLAIHTRQCTTLLHSEDGTNAAVFLRSVQLQNINISFRSLDHSNRSRHRVHLIFPGRFYQLSATWTFKEQTNYCTR